MLEEHSLCKKHFTAILTQVSAKILEYNGAPLVGIYKMVKDLNQEMRKAK